MQRIKQLLDETMGYEPSEHTIDEVGAIMNAGQDASNEELEGIFAYGCYLVPVSEESTAIDVQASLEMGYVVLAVNNKAASIIDYDSSVGWSSVQYEQSDFDASSVFCTDFDHALNCGHVNIDESLSDCRISEV